MYIVIFAEQGSYVYHEHFMELFRLMVFNATFNNISVISWRCGIGKISFYIYIYTSVYIIELTFIYSWN